VLDALEKGEREGGSAQKALVDDLPLFSAVVRAPAPPSKNGPSPAEEKLAGVHPDELTPKEALELVYALKALTTSASS
jgi:DNA mismatch repair protein MutS